MAMGRPREFDTDTALDRAMEVFWQKGYEGASLAELTKAMGINPPSLYAAFGNKEALFRKAFDKYAAEKEAFFDELYRQPTARAVAEFYLRGAVTYLTDPKRPKGCLAINNTMACGDSADRIRQELLAKRAIGEARMRERLERAKREGDLPETADAAALTRYLSTVLQGMAVQALGGATREDLTQVAELAMKAWPST
ncbi:MAG: TetR/AcrR family transcriptional regulator [Rhodospirillales bacterium]|nr:TetR/AcrR family transcriptional regulator [Rhodospirillales bacterium]